MKASTQELTAIIFDIQRGSMVDGPGLRTTVFLKGCPLRCSWCHNPEAIRAEPQTVVTEAGKSKTYGELFDLDTLWQVIEKDRSFYDSSGGGLTISGGEPMHRFEFSVALARRANVEGIHVALDSTGFGSRRQWDAMLQHVDLFLFDYKITAEHLHREHTGVSAKALHANIRYVAEQGGCTRLRCPIIPGINDSAEHFRGIYELAASIPNLDGVDLLSYHDTARFKYAQLGLGYTVKAKPPELLEKQSWLDQIRSHGELHDLCLAS